MQRPTMTSRRAVGSRRVPIGALVAIMGITTTVAPVLAGGGNVLPPTARPKGYSLSDIAVATAFFNTGPRTGPAPKVPFQLLYESEGRPNTFVVRPGTMLYVPIFSVTEPAPGDYPNVRNRQAVLNYVFGEEQLGAELLQVEVDGEITTLGPQYVVGVEVEELPDSDATQYITGAVFLTPLTKGRHTVQVRELFTGAALGGEIFEFEITYTVIVR